MKNYFLIVSIFFLFSNLSCQINILDSLQYYSINFEPKITNKSNIPSIFTNDKDWDKIIKESYEINSFKTNQYLAIVLLKLYKSHLICCKQAYTLSLKNPFVDNFLKINGFYKSKFVNDIPKSLRGDLVWSSLVYDWLNGKVNFLNNNYQKLVKNNEVRNEMKSIRKILNE